MTEKQKPVSAVPREWLEPLAIFDGEPDMYPPEIVRDAFQVGLLHLRGVHAGRRARNSIEAAEQFRRRFEINQIFRFLPCRLRERPRGKATMERALGTLEAIGITCSEETLKRDYNALGGVRALRSIQSATENEKYEPLLGNTKKS